MCVCDFNLNVCCQSVWLAVSKSIIFDFQMRKYKRVTRVKARENRKVGNRIRFGQLRCKHACTKLNAGDEKKKIKIKWSWMNEKEWEASVRLAFISDTWIYEIIFESDCVVYVRRSEIEEFNTSSNYYKIRFSIKCVWMKWLIIKEGIQRIYICQRGTRSLCISTITFIESQ